MVMVSKLSNFPDELSENDELREFELSGSDCTYDYNQLLRFHTVSNVWLCLIMYIQSMVLMVMPYHRYVSNGNSMLCHIIYR